MNNNDDMIRKISGLLAKAEGTDNETEANTFFEGAHRLMLKFMIDEQTIREARGARQATEDPIVVEWEWAGHDAQAKGKAILLNVIARANHVKFLVYGNQPRSNTWRTSSDGTRSGPYSQWGTFIGYERDIERVKVMYASLLIQWARFVHNDFKASGIVKKNEYGYRTGHLVGYASRIRVRYIEIESKVLTTDTNAIMLNIDAQVEAFYKKYMGISDVPLCFKPNPKNITNKVPTWCGLDKGHEGKCAFTMRERKNRRRGVDNAGYSAGHASANNADLGQTRIRNNERITSGE